VCVCVCVYVCSLSDLSTVAVYAHVTAYTNDTKDQIYTLYTDLLTEYQATVLLLAATTNPITDTKSTVFALPLPHSCIYMQAANVY